MNFSAAASLINFLGFALGIALYGMLLMLVVRHPIRVYRKREAARFTLAVDRMLLATAILGLLWNFGNLTELIRRDYWSGDVLPFLTAIAFAALGFLPAAFRRNRDAPIGHAAHGAANLTSEKGAGSDTEVEIRFDLNRLQTAQIYQTKIKDQSERIAI